MGIIEKLDKNLQGSPNYILTGGLLLAGVIAWLVALFATPTLKATVLAWMVAP